MRKRWWKRLVLLLVVTLLLCALVFPANGSSSVYLMAVNETVLDVTAETMPMVSSGQLYIPYTMISPQTTGINLGIRVQYNASRGLLVMTSGSLSVTFDTRKNTAYDAWGTPINARVLVRNSMAFLPVEWLCDYFDGIRYSLSRTPYGTLIRITNSAAGLDDEMFVDAAMDMIYRKYQNYRNSLVSPGPSSTATPNPSPTPTVPPDPPSKPVPTVCLALRCGEFSSEVADLLEVTGQRALFLFTPEELLINDDLVRRLVARGHQIGLVLSGDGETCLEQLAAGRQLMGDIARRSVFIVSAESPDEETRTALKEAGCVFWEPGIRSAATSYEELTAELDPDGINCVELTCNETGLALMISFVRDLSAENCQFTQALPSLLQP